MFLNSPNFLIFLAVCGTIHYLLPAKARNAFLLLASYAFYLLALPKAWYYLGLLIGTTLLSYFAALYVARTANRARKVALCIGTLVPLAVLLLFKYTNFFLGLAGSSTSLQWLVPVGLSFYTFQVIGYVVDAYRGTVKPEKNIINYALFVAFFAQILSGPIARADEMLPQYRKPRDFDYGTVVDGLQRFLLGAFKKCVVADGVARIVNGVYGDLGSYTGLALLAAVLLFAVQLYFDFSGYSDMAVGVGRVLGFRLRENFTAPYMATSIAGFWSRWHISLTSWFRDYIYIPLGGNRKGFARKLLNVAVVFLVSGLWHGASVTYVVWGLLHGLARVIEELMAKRRIGREKRADGVAAVWLKRCGVFLFFAFTLIFFRSADFAQAGYILRNLFVPMPFDAIRTAFAAMAVEGVGASLLYQLFFWIVLLAGMLLITRWDARLSDSLAVKGRSPLLNPLCRYTRGKRWTLYWFMGLTTTAFYMISTASETVSFIYSNY